MNCLFTALFPSNTGKNFISNKSLSDNHCTFINYKFCSSYCCKTYSVEEGNFRLIEKNNPAVNRGKLNRRITTNLNISGILRKNIVTWRILPKINSFWLSNNFDLCTNDSTSNSFNSLAFTFVNVEGLT